MVRNDKDDDADNKLRKGGGGGVGAGFLTSLRRSGFLRVPAAALEEIRPMIGNGSSHASSSSNTGILSSGSSIASVGTTSKGIRTATPPTSSVTRLSASSSHHQHHHHYPPYHASSHQHDNFEISVRDKTDATAKRGFRVQVPKRMLLYTVLVFLGLPLVIFLYVELHLPSHTTTATSNQEQRVKMHAGGKPNLGLLDVLPHSLESTGGAEGDVVDMTALDAKNTTASTNEQGTVPSDEGAESRGIGVPEPADADKKAPDSPTLAKEQGATGTALELDDSSDADNTRDGKGPKTTTRTRRKKGKAKEQAEEGADEKEIDSSLTDIAKDGQPSAVVAAEGGGAETTERVELEKDAASKRGLQVADPSLVVSDAAAVQRRTMLRRRTQR